MANPLDGAWKTGFFLLDMLQNNKNPRDQRNFTGERPSAAIDTCSEDDPMEIVARCEEQDLEEGWPSGTSLQLYLEAQKHI